MGDLEQERVYTARQAKLDAVLSLERECCVSRGYLYRFFSKEELYARMLGYVFEQVGERHVPSIWQAGVLCDRVRAIAEQTLYLLDIRSRAPKYVSRKRWHGVLNVAQTPEEYLNTQVDGYRNLDLASDAKKIGRRVDGVCEDINLWAFDYSQFLVRYCLRLRDARSRSSRLLDNGVLAALFDEAIERDLPYLVHCRVGGQFSFREAGELSQSGRPKAGAQARGSFGAGSDSFKRALARSERKKQKLEEEALQALRLLYKSEFPRTFELERAYKYNFCEIYDYALNRGRLCSPDMQRKAVLAFLICYSDARSERRLLEWNSLIGDAVFWIDRWAKRLVARHRLRVRPGCSPMEELIQCLDGAAQAKPLRRLEDAQCSAAYALAYVLEGLRDEKHQGWLKVAYEGFRTPQALP